MSAKPIRKPNVQPAVNDPGIDQGRRPEHMRDVLMQTMQRCATLFALSVGTLLISAVVATAALILLCASPLAIYFFWRPQKETDH